MQFGEGSTIWRNIQARKRNPNLNFLVRISSGGVGVFPRERVGAKKFDTSLETREIKLFGRDIPGFCRDIPGVPEKFEKKKFGFNFRSLNMSAPNSQFHKHCGQIGLHPMNCTQSKTTKQKIKHVLVGAVLVPGSPQ